MREVKKILVDSASPDTCAAILLSMKKDRIVKKEEIYQKIKEDRGIEIDSSLFRPINRLKDLSIIEETKNNEYRLTLLGTKCKNLLIEDKSLFYDFMHHLHIRSAFDEKMGGYFFTYYLISKYLYEKGQVGDRDKFLSNVLADIEKEFGEINVKSIDTSTISKVISWLKKLTPPFVMEDNKTFRPRKDVNQKVLVMAISAYYDKIRFPFGTPIMIDMRSITEISLMGLIDISYFTSILPILPNINQNISLNDTVDGKAILLRKRYDTEVVYD
jgi:hypothetical protein